MKTTSAALGALGLLGAAVSSSVAAESNIKVLDWAGYEVPDFFQSYMEQYGEAPDYSYFASPEEAYNKVSTGFSTDVAHPCLPNIPKWRDAGLIEPIDTSRLSNWEDVLGDLRTLNSVTQNGKVWMMPFEWGYTSLVYRTDEVDSSDANLDIFINPRYRNRVALPDNVDDVYALASLAIGLDSWNEMTDAQFDKATEWLRKANRNVRFYWGDIGQLNQAMEANEVSAAWTWSQTYAALREEGQPVKMNRDPQEGMSSWVCGYVKTKDGEAGDDEVYDFLDSLLAPESGKYMIESWGYASANAMSFEMADQDIVEKSAFDDVQDVLDKSFVQTPPPPALKDKMSRAYERIKAGF